jgi:hypothetical protein
LYRSIGVFFELHSAAPPQMTQYTGGGILLV